MKLNPHNVFVSFECDKCERKNKNISVKECIHDGPPICKCGNKMSFDEIELENTI